jgi:Peptidase M50B-like
MKGNPCGSTDQVIDTLCAPPEVCANLEDNKREHLIKHTAEDGTNFIQKTVRRDKALFVAILGMVFVMHVPYLKFTLYPFLIFSTWVHEMCHGMAAYLVRGGIQKLYVYKDGSGLCYTWTTGQDWKRAFVASAGYTGTAVIGALFLLFRRTLRGPTVGLIGMGLAMLLSCALYVRNTFGLVAVGLIGVAIIVGGWKLPAKWVLYLYCFLAATCSFNALNSINDLMDMQPGQAYVNGQSTSTDAHTVADLIGFTYGFWALIWLVFGLVMSAIGFLLPFDGLTYAKNKKQMRKAEQSALPQHGGSISMVPVANVQQVPAEASSPVNPDFEARMQQQQNTQPQQTYPWQSVDIPMAKATIY